MNKIIRVIGQRIREFRLQKNLTIEEVAERSGCTPGFLSQIERNKAVPSITLLYAIAEALGTKVADFFPETINAAKVVRHDDPPSFSFEGSPITYSLRSSKFPSSAIEAFVLTILPAREALPTDESRAHYSEEFGYILQGVLRLWHGDTYYDLYPGDSIHFRSTTPHMMENRSDQPVVALWLVTPSIF
jgi:transcriptional regulator with XRE-family HTH domain